MAARRDSVELFRSTYAQIIVGVLLVALIVAARLLPHAANFTPVAAVGLFAGVYFKKAWAPFLPLAGLLISDLFIGGYGVRGMVVVYGSFGLTFLIGKIMARGGLFGKNGRFGKKSIRILGGSILSAVLFFLITNNVFLYTPALYTHDFAGMMASYVAGIPFFRSQILGDLFYSGVLFGACELAKILAVKFSRKSVEVY
ncbi:hypothetical protein FWH58_01135 [Candidatus Saccharibacteria bacterium]|nr:hypothetical protein [Candidatus Saccharibacteria bacterium]